jgi:hypothetical protein
MPTTSVGKITFPRLPTRWPGKVSPFVSSRCYGDGRYASLVVMTCNKGVVPRVPYLRDQFYIDIAAITDSNTNVTLRAIGSFAHLPLASLAANCLSQLLSLLMRRSYRQIKLKVAERRYPYVAECRSPSNHHPSPRSQRQARPCAQMDVIRRIRVI